MKARIAKKVAQRTSHRTRAQRRASRQILERKSKWRPKIWFSVTSVIGLRVKTDSQGRAAYDMSITRIIEENSLKCLDMGPKYCFQVYESTPHTGENIFFGLWADCLSQEEFDVGMRQNLVELSLDPTRVATMDNFQILESTTTYDSDVVQVTGREEYGQPMFGSDGVIAQGAQADIDRLIMDCICKEVDEV